MNSSTGSNEINSSEKLEHANEDSLMAVNLHEEDAGNTIISLVDEAAALQGLTEGVRDQDELERDITHQASLVMIEQEDERDQKRIDKVNSNIDKLESQCQRQRRRLNALGNNPLMRSRCLEEIKRIEADIARLKNDIVEIRSRIDERHQHDRIPENEESDMVGGSRRLPNESRRDFLIRTGKITPFSRMTRAGTGNTAENLTEVLLDAEEAADAEDVAIAEDKGPQSHQNLRAPGFADIEVSELLSPENEFSLRPRKRRRVDQAEQKGPPRQSSLELDVDITSEISDTDFDEFKEEAEEEEDKNLTAKTSTKRQGRNITEGKVDFASIDDGNEQMYQARLQKWVDKRSTARLHDRQQHGWETAQHVDDEEEWFKECPNASDHHLGNGIKLPGDIYPALFDYQKTGVQWLGELYAQQVGGIVGDEMGLGKTIQIISFVAGLHYSKKLSKPVIIVAPATVLQQWVNEFHRWWPPLRVSILHSSGSGMLNVRNEGQMEEEEEEIIWGTDKKPSRSSKFAKKIVDRVIQHGHVLVTTYAGLQTYSDVLIPVDWGYAVLDEGHKIRNPNTAITIYCKELRTANRIILSGTPMQNNLIELWSLFDFVFPMRLGTLVNFRQAFEVPIKLGGYANATNLQIITATKCAETLKTAISPYLLQRLKVDVAADLPKKSEQVLFCKLTKPQREAYETFLSSNEMTSILNHKRQSLYGIDILRKICNHPDLLDPRLKNKPGYKWGNPNKSGKMQVVKALLEMWKRFGHKTLLFTQGVQMLNIIEDYVKGLDGFRYLRMDGSTNIRERQSLVDQFNNDPDLHIFLLTTKVGGLGVNLTGANRVIIFDPDWNPSTDVQARERAWRLGQKKEVTIYRLMTAGTIEEKIYHRQVFKQFLTNKILKDPKQRQTFQMKDLYDLFTLGGTDSETTETSEMFKGTEVRFNGKLEGGGLDNGKISQEVSGMNTSQSKQSSEQESKEINADVRNLTGVAGLEDFRGDPEEEKSSSEENRLMEGIFARSGVHSALEHDQIINGKKVISADRGMIEREARKVAAEAAAELRKAGEVAKAVEPGTVTWTGEFGTAGRPMNIRQTAGPSSASILANLANKQGISGVHSPSSSRSGTPNNERAPRGKDFMRLIRDFIKAQGGSVPSQALVNHFDRMCRTPQQTAEFKHMLGEIARLEKGETSRMRGRWVLRDEFK